MEVSDYTLESINVISFETFYELIQTNKDYIKKGFAGTVKRTQTKTDAEVLFKEWIADEKQGKAFNFFVKDLSKT